MLINLHTHQLDEAENTLSVLNIDVSEQAVFSSENHRFISLGVHPWNAARWSPSIAEALVMLSRSESVLMLGEIGLDKACDTAWNEQLETFTGQLEIASENSLPVLLHAVRSTQEILQLKKRYVSIPNWIIHGFRGKPQEAEQWLRAGFYLSFGARYNSEALRVCPLSRLFLETDTAKSSIAELYEFVARDLSCTVRQLEIALQENFNRVLSRNQ